MKKELIVQKNPKSPISEIFRTLRTNIQFMNSQKKLKTILVTSTRQGEGKSWTSSNLAITFAQAGNKVCLIDADMRKGRLASLFQIDVTPGLSNYLSGIDNNGKVEEPDVLKYVKQTEVRSLFLIPAGNVPPNPAELLSSELTTKMLDKLGEIFDIIILDGAPSLLVTDALILSRIADTTILVSEYGKTKKEDLAKTKRLIENVGGKIAGVIINKTPVKAEEYRSSYYYGDTSVSTFNETNTYINKQAANKIEDISENKISKEKKEEIISQINEFYSNKK